MSIIEIFKNELKYHSYHGNRFDYRLSLGIFGQVPNFLLLQKAGVRTVFSLSPCCSILIVRMQTNSTPLCLVITDLLFFRKCSISMI